MRGRNVGGCCFTTWLGGLLLFTLLLVGCAHPQTWVGLCTAQPSAQELCKGWKKCDDDLYAYGFAYVSPQSPCRDLAKAQRYFDELLRRYPRSPWADQGRAWIARTISGKTAV